jgi:hypothetical protein
MSWSLYFSAKSPAAAKAYVEKQKEPTPEANYGTPRAAKDLILAALDLATISTESVGVNVEASGHSPNGNCRVNVEPLVIVE